jgi:type IV secretory pathway VirB9-like protein
MGIPPRPQKGNMKRCVSLLLIYSLCAAGVAAQQESGTSSGFTRVTTAVNHLTVLEFHEPVTMAAAGSSDFQIERQENKVFVKPMRPGVSTDLFVWTASHRYVYELETQEVKNMNFAIDNPAPPPTAPPAISRDADEFADMMLSRAFLGAQAISNFNMRPAKNEIAVRIQQVFRTRTTVYVHYTIENNSKQAFHVDTPSARRLEAEKPSISVPGLLHRQIDQRVIEKLGNVHEASLPVGHAEREFEEIKPGESTQGVVAIRQNLSSPAIVQLVFSNAVKATLVL